MKSLFSVSLALGALLFTTSCQTWGPNQQTGTVTGALAGAGLGAVIGSNSGRNYHHGRHGYYRSGSGNAGEGALIGAAVGAIAGNLLGASQDQREYYDNRYYPPPEASGTAQSGQPYAELPPRYASTSQTNVNIGVGYSSGYRYGGGGFGSIGVSRGFPIYHRRPYYGRSYRPRYGHRRSYGRYCY